MFVGTKRLRTFSVYDIGKEIRRSDIALILVPDEVAPELCRKENEEEVKKKEHFKLGFVSGYNIAFDLLGCI